MGIEVGFTAYIEYQGRVELVTKFNDFNIVSRLSSMPKKNAN